MGGEAEGPGCNPFLHRERKVDKVIFVVLIGRRAAVVNGRNRGVRCC